MSQVRAATESAPRAASSPRSRMRMRNQLLALALAGFGAIIVLSYALNWSWTGFEGNTLWDWLSLLLLPVAVGLVPFVFDASTRTVCLVSVSLCLALTVVLIGGYAFHWAWTGFEGNTLWDWMHLLLVPAAIPIAARSASDARARRAVSETAGDAGGRTEAGALLSGRSSGSPLVGEARPPDLPKPSAPGR